MTIIESKGVSKSKAKMTPTTSVPALVSTSTLPKNPGPRVTKCTVTSRPSCRRRCLRTSRRSMGRGLVFLDIVWVGMGL